MNLKQERHPGGRRRHGRTLLASLVLASSSLSACANDHGEDSAELQAILHDGDLTQIMASMLTESPSEQQDTGGGSGTGGVGGSGMPGPIGTGGTGVGGTGGAGTGGRAGTGVGGQGGIGGFPTDGGPTDGGGQGPNRNFPREAQGFWRFDDCNMGRTELGDSAFGNHTAFRSVTTFCRPGVVNTGVGFDEDDDLVLVPDQPNFVFSEGFTVAAWVKPVEFGGVRTIFRKQFKSRGDSNQQVR
jgi:hypothetical protein